MPEETETILMTDKPFAGKLALVTGASRGIGTAIAEALGRTGAHVIITARTSGGLEEVEERIHAAGGSATIAPLGLTDGDSIGRLAGDRKGVVEGKRVSVRVKLGGGRIIKKKKDMREQLHL